MDGYRAFYIGGGSASWKDKLKLALLALAGGAVLVAAVILSLGLALVLIPLGFVAYLFRRPLLKAMLGRMNASMNPGMGAGQPRPDSAAEPPRTGRGTVTIETDYTVVETRAPGPPRR